MVVRKQLMLRWQKVSSPQVTAEIHHRDFHHLERDQQAGPGFHDCYSDVTAMGGKKVNGTPDGSAGFLKNS